jgi:hypothetical protein
MTGPLRPIRNPESLDLNLGRWGTSKVGYLSQAHSQTRFHIF